MIVFFVKHPNLTIRSTADLRVCWGPFWDFSYLRFASWDHLFWCFVTSNSSIEISISAMSGFFQQKKRKSAPPFFKNSPEKLNQKRGLRKRVPKPQKERKGKERKSKQFVRVFHSHIPCFRGAVNLLNSGGGFHPTLYPHLSIPCVVDWARGPAVRGVSLPSLPTGGKLQVNSPKNAKVTV